MKSLPTPRWSQPKTLGGLLLAVACCGLLGCGSTQPDTTGFQSRSSAVVSDSTVPAAMASPSLRPPLKTASAIGKPASQATSPTGRATLQTAGWSEWAEGSIHGPWRVAFTGYGSVQASPDGNHVLLQPAQATSAQSTHASLMISTTSYTTVRFRSSTTTMRQLRQGSTPNPWECAWMVWHYTDNTHFYYLALKPNGWELGKEDPAYPGAQRFLATGVEPTFPIGRESTVTITQVGPTMTAAVAGQVLVTFTDRQRPYTSGSVGIYAEDATVLVRHMTVARL